MKEAHKNSHACEPLSAGRKNNPFSRNKSSFSISENETELSSLSSSSVNDGGEPMLQFVLLLIYLLQMDE